MSSLASLPDALAHPTHLARLAYLDGRVAAVARLLESSFPGLVFAGRALRAAGRRLCADPAVLAWGLDDTRVEAATVASILGRFPIESVEEGEALLIVEADLVAIQREARRLTVVLGGDQ